MLRETRGMGLKLVWMAAVLVSGLGWTQMSVAQSVSAAGCPVFHCTPEATGVMQEMPVQSVVSVVSNSKLGELKGQGCSGDVGGLFCVVQADALSGQGSGTVKSLDVRTLQPLWGTASAANSWNLDAATAGVGQVPFIMPSGAIAVGDATWHVLYDRSGSVMSKASLGGTGKNFGMTPISDRYGVVSQSDGVLTLVDTALWKTVSVLKLVDPQTGGAVSLVSPSSGTANVLYAIGFNAARGRGLVFSVVVDQATQALKVRYSFAFTGRSGASPVVATTAVTSLQSNLVLVHVPGLIGETTPVNRLLALKDNGLRLSTAWQITLPSALQVSPTLDQVSKTLFYALGNDASIYQNRLDTGAAVRVFNIQTLSGLGGTFALNGHLVASQAGGQFSMFLSGSLAGAGVQSNGQYVMTFLPAAETASILWQRRIAAIGDAYTGALTMVPASQPGMYCPVVVGSSTGVTRLCDF